MSCWFYSPVNNMRMVFYSLDYGYSLTVPLFCYNLNIVLDYCTSSTCTQL